MGPTSWLPNSRGQRTSRASGAPTSSGRCLLRHGLRMDAARQTHQYDKNDNQCSLRPELVQVSACPGAICRHLYHATARKYSTGQDTAIDAIGIGAHPIPRLPACAAERAATQATDGRCGIHAQPGRTGWGLTKFGDTTKPAPSSTDVVFEVTGFAQSGPTSAKSESLSPNLARFRRTAHAIFWAARAAER